MANIPQKSKDPTEEALSAIEEALNVRSPDARPAPAVAPPVPPSAGHETGKDAPPVSADLFHSETPAPPAWSGEPAPRRPANDDRANIGHILQTLHRRPSRTPHITATVAALAWAAAGVAGVYLYSPDLTALFADARTGVIAGAAIAAGIGVPVIFFYVLAHLTARAQDMRIVAESLAEAALRLGQPESVASESIVTVGQAIRREVTAMGDGVERALARAAELEVLVHNEVSQLERAYNDNEVRIRDLLSGLAHQREILVSQAEQVRNAIASVHLDLSHDITSVGDLVSDKVNEVAQRVTRALTEKGEHITLALGHAGDSMIDALNDRGSTLLGRLEQTSDQTTTAIASATDRLTDGLKFKTETVHQEFAELADRLQQTLTERLDRVNQTFDARATATIDEMAARSHEFTTTINDTTVQIAETIAVRAGDVNATLRSTGDSLVQDLTLRGGEVVSKLEQTGQRMTDAIAARGEDMHSALRSTGEALVADLGQRGNDVVANIEQTGSRVADAIVTRSNTITENFRDGADTLVRTIDERGDALKDLLSARLAAFEDIFNRSGTELSEKVARDASTLGNLIIRHVAEFDHIVKTYGGELVERLSARTQDVSEAMRAYLDTFDARVTGRTEELTGTLDQRLAQFEGILAARLNDIARTLGDGGRELVGALDTRVGEVAGTINARGAEVADTIGAKADEIDRNLGTRALEVANTLDSRIGRFEELLVDRTQAVTEQIESRTQAAAEAVHARMAQVSHAIEVNSAEAERKLAALAAATGEAIRTSASEAERTLLSTGDQVAHGLTAKADEIVAVVGQSTQKLESVLSERSGSVLAAIAEKGGKFADEVAQATAHAVSSIAETGLAFSRSVVENSTEIAHLINSAGENAAGTVSRTMHELRDTADQAIAESKEAASAAVSEMMETHNMLRSDATALFARLREANVLLQEVLSGSHENMSALENTLMLRVSEFVGAMQEVTASTAAATDRVEANVGNFREVTGQVLVNLGEIARQFDAHGRTLADAANLVDTSNQRSEERINERRVQLDSLIATLDIRTEDLEQRLTRFSNLLDESLEAAAGRAREVARVVSESSADGVSALTDQCDRVRRQTEDVARIVSETSSESARMIAEQYERVREEAEAERRRTAAAMHDIFEQSAGDTQALFADANERFATTVRDMKQMAAEMQRELEETRAELRRGVFELPQETAESAAQMRRVIVDQIEALAELNRIVARHGRNLDTVEPVRRAREESSLSATGGRAEAAPSRVEVGPRAELSSRAALRANDATAFAPTARRMTEPPALTQAVPMPPGRGWLTDLLNRASREDGEPPRESLRDNGRDNGRSGEERSPRHSIESLDSLSVDIARMIDHDAAADLWDRYKRGERNVFTRRLYTLQGQQAFDEIRRKYRADREFKQTVDRYIGEFERLLEEVSRDDRSQVVARTYLTSETGKVYTMLAHAAGRFD